MIFFKNKKTISVISLLVLFLLVIPKPAWAQLDCLSNLTDCLTDVLLSIINLIVDFVGMILIGIAASIVNFVFNFQGFIKVPLVQIGWTLSRDIANMAFILIMLAMAFGTILRFESYGWKKLLPRLIIMALLINFSLMIAGGVIDVANSIAKFFISGGGDNNVGDMIMSSIRAGSIAQIRNNISSVGAAVNALIMASIIQLIFYIIIAFLLFALGFMMIIRIVKLWIMIILAPFSWIGWAIPFTSSSLKKWWSDFLHQAFFPALMGFFIFLGTLAGSTLSGTDFERFSKDVGGFWGTFLPTTLFSSIMQFIVVVFILFMGLNMANSWSNGAGEAMVKLAGDGQKWAKQKAWKGAKALPGTAIKTADRFAGGRIQRSLDAGRERLEKAPLIGRAIGGPGARFARQQKALKDAEVKLKNLRPQDLRATLNQVAITPEGQARRAAALSQLADKGKLEDGDKKYIQDFQAAGGNIKNLLERRLDWAFDEMIQGMMAKDFNFPEVARAWKEIANLASGSDKRLTEVKKAIQDIIPKKPEDMAKLQKDTITATDKDTESAKKAKEEIKKLITEEFKKDGRLYVNSLSAIANKSPETYYQVMMHLNKLKDTEPTVYATLKPEIQKHLEAGPLWQAATAPAPAAPAPTP